MRTLVEKTIPAPILSFLRGTLDAVRRIPGIPSAMFHPWRRDTIRRLSSLQNKYRGKRCFIIGNGPSLNGMDLGKLRGEFTIGMNRIYLMFPELGFQTSFYLCINDLVVEQCAADIQRLNIPRFVSWRARQWLKPSKDLFYLYTTYTGPQFAKSAKGRLWEGATVTYAAMQLAYHLGFEQVILIGVDHNFVSQGKPNTTVVSQGDDPNHFSPLYFNKGFRWQLPDLETSERAYRMALDAYTSAGREIIDATVGGKLQVFRKADYDSLF